MKVLNRQSELYQHLYNDALMRLARVPELIDLKPVKAIDFLTYHTEHLGYVFNRDELLLPSPELHGNYANLGEATTERLRDILARSYGNTKRASISVPITVAWPIVLLSVLGEMRRAVTTVRDYIDIEQTAHYAVMRYVYQVTRLLNRGGEDRNNGYKLTLDQAIMELIAGNKPAVARSVPGLEGEVSVGMLGGNPLNWGMQGYYNACETVVSYLNNMQVKTWEKLINGLYEQYGRISASFHLNAPWAVDRLPIEGEAFIDTYGVPAISTFFGNMVDSYYRTDETMSVERALKIIETYSQENDTVLPITRIFGNLRDTFRSKWLELAVVDPIVLRDIAQEEFDQCFELIRAVRVVRQHLVD